MKSILIFLSLTIGLATTGWGREMYNCEVHLMSGWTLSSSGVNATKGVEFQYDPWNGTSLSIEGRNLYLFYFPNGIFEFTLLDEPNGSELAHSAAQIKYGEPFVLGLGHHYANGVTDHFSIRCVYKNNENQ